MLFVCTLSSFSVENTLIAMNSQQDTGLSLSSRTNQRMKRPDIKRLHDIPVFSPQLEQQGVRAQTKRLILCPHEPQDLDFDCFSLKIRLSL